MSPCASVLLLPPSALHAAAGADIKEMASLSYAEAYVENRFKEFARLTGIRKPVSGRGKSQALHSV